MMNSFDGFSVFVWGLAYVFFEDLREILDVHYAAEEGYALYLKMGSVKQMLCMLHSFISYIFRNSLARISLEHGGEISGTYALVFRYRCQRERCGKVGIYEHNCLLSNA